ncbi:hypothetical protein NPIL_82711 [Nephila pilipes]|uniref:Uncharacterized protein n=1 Tax=Nephila pilipes TaxID=299642 RepID=A0A8X6PDB5_NEPPI|nr:hypothetical protein NPIL_82711 [Nephila pilipes]
MRKSTPLYHQKKMFPVKQPPQDRKLLFQIGDKEVLQEQQDKLKLFADQKRPTPSYTSGDLVLVTKPNQSHKNAGVTSKFVPRRDGPFVIVERKSPVSYSVANTDSPQLPV